MQKNALFFGKNWKIAAALGAEPPNLAGLRRLGALRPDPRAITPVTVTFSKAFVALTSLLSNRNKKT